MTTISPFQRANELAILFAGRKVEWRTIPTETTAPTPADAGTALPTTAIRTMIAVKPGAAATTIRVWLYVEALEDWFEVPGSTDIFEALTLNRIERIAPAGAQRIWLESDQADAVLAVGYSILE